MEHEFIYRPSHRGAPKAQDATLGVKFAQRTVILDPLGFMLMFKKPWQRILFRLRHPFAYSKRGLIFFWRRVKSIFIKPKYYMCRDWITKEEMLKHFPESKNNGN